MGNWQSSRTRWLFTFLALFGLVLAAACGGSGNNNSPAPPASGISGAAATVQPAPPDQQVLRLRLQGEPKTIDPQVSSVINEASLMKPLFAGLFTYDQGLNIVASVAKQVPTVENGGISADGKTYTIQLVEDAKWSDGKPLTAGDFVYSMQRELDPATAGPYASFFYAIAGAKDYNKAMGTKTDPKTPSDADLASLRSAIGVSAQGDHTLVYQLAQPDPSFLDLLASWAAYPVRQDVIDKYGATWTEPGNIVSDGPYVLSQWDHNSRIVYTPNASWFGTAPKLTRIEVNFIADDAAAYAAYLAGELDSVTVPSSAIKEVTAPGSDLSKQLTITPDLRTYALFMNNKSAPFDNKLVRQAFGTAIDRQAYVDGVLQGAGVPTTSWVPPGMPGYDKDLGTQYSFD
ncbi:MAG TPA: peptide ABC transporter substrate-binding protein, partial [Dehalococcoidia bacterium]|nr:peptide ABC transporter substrate-binding protein [Dehalococcoidia bacterium]